MRKQSTANGRFSSVRFSISLTKGFLFITWSFFTLTCHSRSGSTSAPSSRVAMETEELTVRVGETKEVQIASRGASGLQLLVRVDNADLVSVSRRELTSPEMASLPRQAGNSMPAFFLILGNKSGRTHIQFYEKPAGSRQGPELPVKDYSVIVTD